MKLRDYQDAVRGLSFARDARAPLAALPGFALYRDMIRARFFAMAEVAFRHAWSLAPCSDSFARYLEAEPPASPILREVIAGFAPFALRDAALLASAPPAFPDVVRFEAAKWQVASSAARLPDDVEVRELDFDGVLVCNPTLVTLALRFDASESLAEDPQLLLVYRRDGDDDVHWYRAPESLRALLEAGERSIAACVRDRFAGHTAEQGQAYLEQLAGALAVAVERGVILGVRDPRVT